MTTYSATISKNNLAVARIERPSVHRLNLALLAILIMLAGAFVFLANLRVAWEYSLNMQRSRLSALNAKSVLQDQSSTNSSLEALLLFTQKTGMVEAKDVGSILQDGNFALIKTN